MERALSLPTPPVEFIGLPGAGKTTVLREVCALLDAAGRVHATNDDLRAWMQARSRLSRALLALGRPLQLLGHLWAGYRFARSAGRLDRNAAIRVRKSPWYAVYLEGYCAEHPGSCVLLDQWGLQNLWSIGAFSGTFDERRLDRIVQALTQRPRLYVYLDADQDLAAARLAARAQGNSRIDDLGATETREVLARAARLMQAIVARLERSRARLLVLDARAGVDENARRVYQFMCGEPAPGTRSP